MVQEPASSATFSKPVRSYIMRLRLCTATDRDSAWKPSSRPWIYAARRSASPIPLRRCSGATAIDSSGVFSSTKP